MLCDIFGLRNYLLHLDYIDREIAKERMGKINNEIKNFENVNNFSFNNNDNNSINNNNNNNRINQINSNEKLNSSKDFSEFDKTEENFSNI